MRTVLKVPPGARVAIERDGTENVYSVEDADGKSLGKVRTSVDDVAIREDPDAVTIGYEIVPSQGHHIEIVRHTFHIE